MKNRKVFGIKEVSFSALMLLLTPCSAHAGGYEIVGHSEEGTGLYYAGAVSGYEDGSSAYYNPAAMSIHDKTTLSIGGHVVPVVYNFHDRGSTVLGQPNIGDDTGERTFVGPLADIYLVTPLSSSMHAGFLLTSPYGLGSKYSRDFTGRYQGVKGELETLKIGGAISYDVTDSLSFGAGIAGIYADATLENAIDFGTIGVATLGFPTASQLGLSPQGNDGLAKLTADDWGMGWNVGTLYRYGSHKQNRFGIEYRSATVLSPSGDASFEVPSEALLLTSTGAFANSAVHTRITLPEEIRFGATQWVDDEWALLWESVWTRWSRFQQIDVEYDNPAQANSVDAQNWRNIWRHSIGVKYRPGGAWEFRSGFGYDQSAVKNAENRGPLIPISDEYSLAAGATYHLDENVALLFGYSHTFLQDSDSDRIGPTGDEFKGRWRGSGIDIVSASVTYAF